MTGTLTFSQTLPVAPSIVTFLLSRLSNSSESAVQLTTAGLFIARATTAAWLVAPPVRVRMPAAAAMPPMSSGSVSWRA